VQRCVGLSDEDFVDFSNSVSGESINGNRSVDGGEGSLNRISMSMANHWRLPKQSDRSPDDIEYM